MLFNYIDFLISTHPCVTIPGFGAFIVTHRADYGSEYEKPQVNIGFNPQLKHDDGILASYLSNREGINYQSALHLISKQLKEISKQLATESKVTCGTFGTLRKDDREYANSYIFQPNENYTLPCHYGLGRLSIQKLENLSNSTRREKRQTSIHKLAITVAASAAAVLLLLAPKTGISNHPSREIQSANFLETISEIKPNCSIDIQNIELEEELQALPDSTIIMPTIQAEVVEEAETTEIEEEKKPLIATKSYYIIIGGEATESKAEKLLTKIKINGFTNAQILPSKKRYRVYVDTFTNKTDGEKALIQFRKDNPEHKDAWLYGTKK